jgi:ankyrin repeat protein
MSADDLSVTVPLSKGRAKLMKNRRFFVTFLIATIVLTFISMQWWNQMRKDAYFHPFQIGNRHQALTMCRAYPQFCNERDAVNESPLYQAVEENWDDVVAVLCEQGADATEQTGRSQNLTHKAAMFGSAKLLKTLLDHGADGTGRSVDGRSALYSAVWGLNIETARLLLENGFDANYGGSIKVAAPAVFEVITTNRARSSLDTRIRYRTETRRIPIMKLLLEHGADFTLRSKEQTLLQIAKETDGKNGIDLKAEIEFLQNHQNNREGK